MEPDAFEDFVAEGVRALARAGSVEACLAVTAPGQGETRRGEVRFAELPAGTLEAEAVPVAVRHYRRGGMVQAFVRDRYPSFARAADELRLYQTARARGVPTLEPIAAIGRKARGWGWRLDLVTRAEPGIDLGRLLAHGFATWPVAARATVLRAAGQAIRALVDAGVDHPDLNLTNLLLRHPEAVRGGDAASVLVIDLDKAWAGPPGSIAEPRAFAMLCRLHCSLVKRPPASPPSRADLVRLARGYLGGRDRPGLRRLEAAVRKAAARHGFRRLLWRRG